MSIRQTILDNIVTTLSSTKDDPDYESNIASVTLFNRNTLVQDDFKIPLVQIIDEGRDEPIVRDDTNIRFQWEVGLYGVVRSDTEVDLHDKLNKLVSTLREYVESSPSLGSNVLDIKFIGTESRFFEMPTLTADCMVHCRITYWTTKAGF
jgi:hypothetical protein